MSSNETTRTTADTKLFYAPGLHTKPPSWAADSQTTADRAAMVPHTASSNPKRSYKNATSNPKAFVLASCTACSHRNRHTGQVKLILIHTQP